MIFTEQVEICKSILREHGMESLKPRKKKFFVPDAQFLASHTATIIDDGILSSPNKLCWQKEISPA
jgi:hypothetical protein